MSNGTEVDPVTLGEGDDASPPAGEYGARPLPSWFVAGLAAAVVWCAAAGALGIAALMGGWYNATLVGGVATPAAAVAAITAGRRLGPRARADHGAVIVALGLVVVFFVLAGALHSEHLLMDRDPALYINTGRSIARTHELRPKTHVGVFAQPAFGSANGRYQPNFFPMLPVLLALGWSIGGDGGMLLVGPLLGALGLLAGYAFASRVLGPRPALLVPLFLMIEPLQLWFARDAYSELVVQVLVLGGLWLYLEARAHARWGIALLSGAVVASSALARIDALSITIGALLLVAAQWVRCDSDATPVRARRVVLAFGSALLVGTLVALWTTQHVARAYVVSLGSEYHQLLDALGAAVVGVVAVIVVHRLRPGIGRRLAQAKFLFAAAVVVSTAVFVWAYFGRPEPRRDLPIPVAGQPISRALRDAIVNWHYSWSLHWFSSYLGVFTLAAAFGGFVILASRARRGNGAAAAVFLVVVPVAIMYIARPSISPDQPWAMRRYLPVVIPGIAIAVIVALESSWRAARAARGALARTAAASGVVALVALVMVPTAAAAPPFARARMQHGAEAALHDICRKAGNDGAVLVYGYRYLNIELPQAIRGFCGVPVAWSGSPTIDLLQLARQSHALGSRLIVATAIPDYVRQKVPGATIIAHDPIADDVDPERPLERRPEKFEARPRDIWLLQIPVT